MPCESMLFTILIFILLFSTLEPEPKEEAKPSQVQDLVWKISELHHSSNVTEPEAHAITLLTSSVSGLQPSKKVNNSTHHKKKHLKQETSETASADAKSASRPVPNLTIK